MRVDTDERNEIAAAMRRGLQQSGLTQAAFAVRLGTSPTRLSTYLSGKTVPSAAIYLRALRLGAAFDRVHRQGLTTPDATAAAVDQTLNAGDEDFALRLVLQARDDVRGGATQPADLRQVWAHRARRITDERFDTLLRAIIAHELGDEAPAWAKDARLDRDWVVADPFRDEDSIRAQTPDWLAHARIFIAQRGLVTV
ncbi:MAG: helix-turn-helix transcriptional regulator [Propionibacteriaceae bacterium]|nr:helix-turn-helix transcriptional regulator [Propionibacteriaceae bacterium]